MSSLQELKKQARQLSVSDRLELVHAIIESLQDVPNQQSERSDIIKQMKGLLKTDEPAPTDEQVAAMLEERTDKQAAFHQALIDAGLVKQIKHPSYNLIPEQRLIQVEGKPVSETLIAERR